MQFASVLMRTPVTAHFRPAAQEVTIDKLAYSVEELARLSSVGRTKLYEEIKDGRLRTRKVGSRTLILADDAKDWLRGQSGPARQA